MIGALVAAGDINVAHNVGFGIIAAAMILGAVRVVTSKNVVHAALWLVVVLSGVAAQYILAAAEFVGVSQVLVYVGAVMVLFLFGSKLTRAQIGQEHNLNNRYWALGILPAGALLAVLAWGIIDVFGDDKVPTREDTGSMSTQAIADGLLSDYLVPFLALSFILLAAAIGAIVLARKD